MKMIFNYGLKWLLVQIIFISLVFVCLIESREFTSNIESNDELFRDKKRTLLTEEESIIEQKSNLFVELYKLLKSDQLNSYQKKLILIHMNKVSKDLMSYFDGRSDGALYDLLAKSMSRDDEEQEEKTYERAPFKWGK